MKNAAVDVHQARQARTRAVRQFAIERAAGRCELRLMGCTDVAADVVLGREWRNAGFDAAPAFGVHAACEPCAVRWNG